MYLIGDYIRHNREKMGISQRELAEGICTEVTLSRIENNKQAPKRTMFMKIIKKLALPPSLYPVFMNEREVELYRMQHEINQHLIHERHDDIKDLLEDMKRKSRGEVIFEQYVAYVHAVLLMKSNPKEALKALKRAVKISVKDLNPKSIPRQVLTQDEMGMFKTWLFVMNVSGSEIQPLKYFTALWTTLRTKWWHIKKFPDCILKLHICYQNGWDRMAE